MKNDPTSLPFVFAMLLRRQAPKANSELSLTDKFDPDLTIDAVAEFLNLKSSCHEVRRQRRHFLHIDELEAKTICKVHGCCGQCRLAKVRTGETSGFVG